MTWYFNDQVIEAGDRYMITFDGTYATLFIASCIMADMGEYKVVFENSAGADETTGKVTVKPVSTFISSYSKTENIKHSNYELATFHKDNFFIYGIFHFLIDNFVLCFLTKSRHAPSPFRVFISGVSGEAGRGL